MTIRRLCQGDRAILKAPEIWRGHDEVEAIFRGYANHRARIVDTQALLPRMDPKARFVVFEICHGFNSPQHVYAIFAVMRDGSICDPRTEQPVEIARLPGVRSKN